MRDLSRNTLLIVLYAAGVPHAAALQAQFDVASLKPVDAAAVRPAMRDLMRYLLPRGVVPFTGVRVSIRDASLLSLVAMATRVELYQVAGPQWMADDDFTIEAKPPQGSSQGALNEMLLNLLTDRFDLKWHSASRVGRAYDLVVDKGGSRLTAAVVRHNGDTNADRAMQMPPELGPGVTVWGSVTSEKLSENLATLLHSPVYDSTGLQGRYRVVLQEPLDRAARASDDWIFAAVDDLGLHLKPVKAEIQEIIVDSALRVPKPN